MNKNYSKAGVDLEAGYKSVQLIKQHLKRTHIAGAINSLGAFGGMFDISKTGIKEPVLVSGTDGVGTKLMIAFMTDKHDTIGQDLVAMCVNDVLVQGAMPLFFLDYIAIDKNYPKKIATIVKGVADACVQAECTLIGGETAEMPDLYSKNHYDLAGFCVGIVEKKKLITGIKIKPDNVIIGLPSSGIHSNGYSLVRKILFKDNNISLNTKIPNTTKTLKDILLTPTNIYVKAIKNLLKSVAVNGMCHITGGGFYENLPRILKKDTLQICIEKKSIPQQAIFKYLQEKGKITEIEMYNVFNMGIGYTVVVDKKDLKKSLSILRKYSNPVVLGYIKDKKKIEPAVCLI